MEGDQKWNDGTHSRRLTVTRLPFCYSRLTPSLVAQRDDPGDPDVGALSLELTRAQRGGVVSQLPFNRYSMKALDNSTFGVDGGIMTHGHHDSLEGDVPFQRTPQCSIR